MSSMSSNFNASVIVSEQLNKLLLEAAQDLAIRAVSECASTYGFDANEAIRSLCLSSLKVSRKAMKMKPVREVVVKPSFPLPYNGEMASSCCQALRQNNGLYTQCQQSCVNSGSFCKGCQVLADKSSDGIPEYGTIQMRNAVGILEYVDPKGRRPVAYTKVMKKYKVSQEQVLEEAGKFNMNIAPVHFEVVESESKRGRPKTEKVAKEPKGAKGRPKKSKKVLEVENDEDDLFASLVADANASSDDEADMEIQIEAEPQPMKKKGKSEEEKEAERVAKEEAKAAKEAERQQAKAQKKQAEEEAKAQKKQAEEEAKAAKEAQRQLEKAQKEAKKKAEEEAKAAKAAKPSKAAKVVAAVEEEEEQEVIRKIVFDGVKYLKSRASARRSR
jgi:chemotaxis protein histidine kinase CheA